MVSGNSCDLVLAFSVGLLNDSRSLSNTSEPPSCYKPSKLNFPKKNVFSVIFLMTWAHIKVQKKILFPFCLSNFQEMLQTCG